MSIRRGETIAFPSIMKRQSLALLLTALITASAPVVPAADEVAFQSKLIGQALPYAVILPEGYHDAANRERRWPLVILLHGWGGNHRSFLTDEAGEREAAKLRWIIAMPEGGNSLWTDSAAEPRALFERYVVEEWLPAVEARYRCSAHRVVAGFSSGGYGPLKLALRHPQKFAGAIAVGTETRIGDFTEQEGVEFRAKDAYAWRHMNDVLGPSDSAHRRANQLFRLAADRDVFGPRFTLICGRAEPAQRLEGNRRLAKMLGITLQETAARHLWEDYAAAFAKALKDCSPTTKP